MTHKAIFFENEMIGRKYCDNRIRIAFMNEEQREQDSRQSFLIRGLEDHPRQWFRCKLAANLAEFEVLFCDNDKKPLCGDQFFGAMPGVLQHGSSANEVDILFRQIVAPSLMDKRLQSPAFARR
jgi:hypothetical protein